MRKYEFYQLDVFAKNRFEGNPLAVFPEAEGVSDAEMQKIANEMNLSETVFVLPSEAALRRLRIFTPKRELPLAGHPVVGTWKLLADLGITENPGDGPIEVLQELNLGILPVEIEFSVSKASRVTMTQGEFKVLGTVEDEKMVSDLAGSLGLGREDLKVSDDMPVQAVSTGIGSLAVPVASLESLGRIRVDSASLSAIYLSAGAVGCYAFTFDTRESGSFVHARFFAPADSIPEDAATGSAAGSLSGYLAYHGHAPEGQFTIEQGDFMGRPSRIFAEVDGERGSVRKVRIGGASVIVAKGEVWLD